MMGWEDKVQNLLGHCTSYTTFGGDFTHLPEDWPEQTLKGVWSDTYLMVDPETNMQIMTSDPNIGVRMSDFLHAPRKNDLLRRKGVDYRIRAIEPDGQGGSTLVLEKMKECP